MSLLYVASHTLVVTTMVWYTVSWLLVDNVLKSKFWQNDSIMGRQCKWWRLTPPFRLYWSIEFPNMSQLIITFIIRFYQSWIYKLISPGLILNNVGWWFGSCLIKGKPDKPVNIWSTFLRLYFMCSAGPVCLQWCLSERVLSGICHGLSRGLGREGPARTCLQDFGESSRV